VKNTSKASVASGVLWSSLKNWGTRVTTLLVFLVVARLLTPAEMGFFAFALGVVTICAAFSDLGLAEFAVYNKTERIIESSIWWLQLAIALLLSVGMAILFSFDLWQTSELPEDGRLAFYALLATLPLVTAVKVPEAIMRRRMEFQALAARSMISIIFGAVVGVALALSGAGLWSLVAKQIVEAVADFFLYFKMSGWRPFAKPSLQPSFVVFQSGWGIVASRVIDALGQRADALIIGTFLGFSSLGQYSMALRVFQVLNEGIVQPVTSVIATAFAHTKEDPFQRRSFFLASVEFASLITAPIFALSIMFGDFWLPFFFGAQWVAAGESFAILSLTGLIIGFSSLNGFSLLANGSNREFVVLTFFGSSVSIMLLIGACYYLPDSVAWALPLKAALVFPLSLWLAKKLIGFDLRGYLLALRPAAFASFAAFSSAFLFQYLSGRIWPISSLYSEAFSLSLTSLACGIFGYMYVLPNLKRLRGNLSF
jgi:O-antigen/teichoic acid export membrane protein